MVQCNKFCKYVNKIPIDEQKFLHPSKSPTKDNIFSKIDLWSKNLLMNIIDRKWLMQLCYIVSAHSPIVTIPITCLFNSTISYDTVTYFYGTHQRASSRHSFLFQTLAFKCWKKVRCLRNEMNHYYALPLALS